MGQYFIFYFTKLTPRPHENRESFGEILMSVYIKQ